MLVVESRQYKKSIFADNNDPSGWYLVLVLVMYISSKMMGGGEGEIPKGQGRRSHLEKDEKSRALGLGGRRILLVV
jgi:hypothetical protein